MGVVKTKHLQAFADGFEQKIKSIFAKKEDIPKTLPASGGNADSVNGHTVDSDVPQNAKFTDTTYGVMTAATDLAAGTKGLVPAPGIGMQNAFLCGDGQWRELEEATDEEIAAIINGTFE